MATRPTLAPWRIALGLLLLVALAAGLGAVIGLVVIGVRVLFEPALRILVALPAILVVVYAYGRWVWTPIWRFKPRKNERHP